MGKKHILLVSQYFYPETFRVNDMAAAWVKRGFRVTVLTGIPNYPMGKYYDGYDLKHRRHEIWNGVEIIRIPLIARGNSRNKYVNAVGMCANYLSFAAFGYRWVRSKKAAELCADLVFTVEVSPMTQALIGCWYGKRYHVPVYLYVQDLWPENVETITGIHSPLILGPTGRMVDWIYRHTDQIFAASPAFVKAIVKRGAEKSRVHYWPQYAEAFYRPIDRAEALNYLRDCGSKELAYLAENTCKNTFYIAFTGNIGMAQGLDILPGVAKKLKAMNKAVRFIIVGDGRYQNTLEREIADRNVEDMFLFVPRQKAEIIPWILAVCDAAFLSFSNQKLWEMTIPAKLQSYMACGMPVIAAAGGETERIVNSAACGLCSPVGSADKLAAAIVELEKSDLDVMRKNSKRYADKNFRKQLLMDEMERRVRMETG